MATVKQEQIDIFDKITGEKLCSENAYIVDDGKNKLLIPKQAIIRNIISFAERHQTNDSVKTMNCNTAELYNACNKMCDIVTNITEDDMVSIIDNLPRWKNGNIRSTKIPLYMTGITIATGATGNIVRVTSLELTVRPHTTIAPLTNDPASIFVEPKKTPHTYELTLSTDRVYNKNDKPLMGEDGAINKLEIKKNSCIPIEDLIQGCIYTDAKDREFLYIGDMVFSHCMSKKYKKDHGMINKSESEVMHYPYSFLGLNNKRKAELAECATFGEYMEHCLSDKKLTVENNSFMYINTLPFAKSTKHFKVTTLAGKLFDPADMVCDVKYTIPDNNQMKHENCREYDLECTIIATVTDKKCRRLYTVLASACDGNPAQTVISTTDKALCNERKKRYEKTYPNHVVWIEESITTIDA